MTTQQSRWITYSNWAPTGPYLILITDIDWWHDNTGHIDIWFYKNCPRCKPDLYDSVIQFETERQLLQWQSDWKH